MSDRSCPSKNWETIAKNHGAKAGDKNAYSLQVFSSRREASPFYLAGAPPGNLPGVCAPVTIYSFTGGFITSIPAGGNWQQPPPSGDCPTLVEMLAGLTMYQVLALFTPEQIIELGDILNADITVVDGGWPDSTYGGGVDPGGIPPPDPEDYEADDHEAADYYT